MDAKSKSDFIKQVNQDRIYCTACGESNPANRKVCFQCGAPLKNGDAPAQDAFDSFPEIDETPAASANKPAEPVSTYVEPPKAFAEGLPEWSIEPPQVMVRRR